MRRLSIFSEPDYMGAGIFYRGKEKYQHDPELMEAYEEGCRHGYKKAMKEFEEQMDERRATHWGGEGGRDILYRGGQGGGRGGNRSGGSTNYREYDEYEDDDMEYRRRRDSRGRFM
jgi:hypothetical protein